jgi:hypothetical protein
VNNCAPSQRHHDWSRYTAVASGMPKQAVLIQRLRVEAIIRVVATQHCFTNPRVSFTRPLYCEPKVHRRLVVSRQILRYAPFGKQDQGVARLFNAKVVGIEREARPVRKLTEVVLEILERLVERAE